MYLFNKHGKILKIPGRKELFTTGTYRCWGAEILNHGENWTNKLKVHVLNPISVTQWHGRWKMSCGEKKKKKTHKKTKLTWVRSVKKYWLLKLITVLKKITFVLNFSEILVFIFKLTKANGSYDKEPAYTNT